MALVLPLASPAQSFQSTTYHEEDGLVANRVFAITQDRNGSILAVTPKGVSSFDGTEWSTFPDSLRLPNHRQTKAVVASDDRVWLAGYYKEEFRIMHFDGDRWAALPPLPDTNEFIRRGSIGFDIRETSQGTTILVSNYREVWLHSTITGEWRDLPVSEISSEALVQGACFNEDTVLALTTNGLWRLDEGHAIRIPLNTPNDTLVQMVRDPESRVHYLLGPTWLGKLEGNTFTSLLPRFPKLVEDPVRSSGLLVDHFGRIIFGSNSKFKLFDPEDSSVVDLDFAGQIESFWHNYVFVDRENNIWISTDRGLAILHNLRFQYYNHRHGLFENEISGAIAWGNDALLVGGNYFLGLVSGNRCKTLYQVDPSIKRIHRISNFVGTKDGVVYFTGFQKGIGRVLPDTTVEWLAPPPSPAGVNALTLMGDSLIVASDNELYYWNGSSYEWMGQTGIYIRRLYSREGKLWALTSGGIFILQADRSWKVIRSRLRDRSSISCLLDYDGQLLVGTYAGLAQVFADSIGPPLEVPAITRPVFDMIADNQGRLWMGSDRGVYALDDQGLRHFDRSNGLVGNDINRGTMLNGPNGTVYIGTERGLAAFHSRRDYPDALIPPVPRIISMVTNTGKYHNPDAEFSLESGENGLEVTLGGIAFTNQSEIGYRIQLEGFDPEWIELTGPKHISRNYTNLPGGTYRFRLQVRLLNGEWSETVSTANFTIAGPVYTQWWFWVLVVSGVVSIGVLVFSIFAQKRVKKILQKRLDEHVAVIRQSQQDLRRRNQELTEVNQELTKVNNELDSFVYRVAHDLRGPLAKMLGLVHIYRMAPDPEPQLVDFMEDSVTQMDRFISELLDFSKNSRMEIDLSPIDFREIVTNIFKTHGSAHEALAATKTMRIKQEVDFHSDSLRISIILQNLISNAIKYQKPKSLRHTPFVHVEIDAGEDQARIVVSDNGLGIEKEHKKEVFEMFFRGTPKSNGSGLGLFIVAEVVQKFKGTIELDSEPGKGSTFTVVLPNLKPKDQLQPGSQYSPKAKAS